MTLQKRECAIPVSYHLAKVVCNIRSIYLASRHIQPKCPFLVEFIRILGDGGQLNNRIFCFLEILGEMLYEETK